MNTANKQLLQLADIDLPSVLPHQGSMIYIDQIISYSECHLHCTAPKEGAFLPLTPEHRVCSTAAMEYLAQAAAAFAGLHAKEQDQPVRTGMVLSFRDFRDFSGGSFDAEEKLLIQVHLVQSLGATSLFEGEVFDQQKGDLLLKGKFTVRLEQ